MARYATHSVHSVTRALNIYCIRIQKPRNDAMNSSLVCYVARKLNIEFFRPRFSAQTLPPASLREYLKFFYREIQEDKKSKATFFTKKLRRKFHICVSENKWLLIDKKLNEKLMQKLPLYTIIFFF